MPDDVPEEVKRRRNNDLLAVQNAISLEDNQPLARPDVEVLVEGPSKSGAEAGGDWRGSPQMKSCSLSAARRAITSWSSTARGR